MRELVTTLFSFYLLLMVCRISTGCAFPLLNRRFHVRIASPRLQRLLLHRVNQNPRAWAQRRIEKARGLLGIDGILAYLLLVPPALWFLFTRGCFTLMQVRTLPGWYEDLFWGFTMFATADYWLGYFLLWRREGRKGKEEGDG